MANAIKSIVLHLMIIITVNRLFGIGYRRIDRTLKPIIPCKETTFSAGYLMHFFGLGDYVQDTANQTPTTKRHNRERPNKS